MATLYETMFSEQAGPSRFSTFQEQIDALPRQQAPAQQQRQARRPGLMDYIWNAAAGYSPTATRNSFEDREADIAKRDLELQTAQAELAASGRSLAERSQILGSIQNPRERAIAMANLSKWGEFAGERSIRPHSLARGAQLRSGDGELLASNDFTHETGDEIVGVGPDGASPVYTRTAPSIREQIDQNKVAADTALGQAGLGIRRAELDIAQDTAAAQASQRERESAERRTAAEGANVSDDSKVTAMQNAMEGITRHIGSSGAWTSLQPWKRQSRADLEAQITALQGVITLDGLAEMKQTSPNGASGMGAMSEREGAWLASRIAALDPNMSEQELRSSMAEINTFLQTIRDRQARRLQALGPQGGASRAAPSAAPPSRAALEAEARRRGLLR